MATVNISEKRVIVYPITVGADYLGNSGGDDVSAEGVPLTAEYLEKIGGKCLRGGQTWQVRLALKYLDSDGSQTAVNLSGASSTVMHVWHETTGAWVDSRTEDEAITGGGGLVELAIDGDGTAGTLTVTWYQTETVTPGVHNFAILSDWTHSEPLCSGQIEIKAAVPSS